MPWKQQKKNNILRLFNNFRPNDKFFLVNCRIYVIIL